MNAHATLSNTDFSNIISFASHFGTDLETLLPIEGGKPHQVVMYPAGGEIYGQGEKATALYQVAFGTVRVYRLLADGRRQISAFHVAGEVFGFESDIEHHFFAEAICSSGVCVFHQPLDIETASALLPVALKALVRAQEHLLVIGRQSASERVAAFLLDMQQRQGDLPTIELTMARSDIADYLGLTIETVSRTFSKFREAGVIRLTNARVVKMLKPDALRSLCE